MHYQLRIIDKLENLEWEEIMHAPIDEDINDGLEPMAAIEATELQLINDGAT